MNITNIFSTDMTNFLVVALLSLLIGLSQRKLYQKEGESINTFGSDRTFTLIGILGYILYLLGKGSLTPFLCGGLALSVLLGINYAQKIFIDGHKGITSIVIALITYCLAPLIYEKELWVGILVAVVVLILSEMKDKFIQFTKTMNDEEFINLAKFGIIAGVILPILPDTEIVKGIGLTPSTIWLATVVITGISYVSYLLKKYVFKDGGIIVTGILGGIYSSTATCIILAKKAKDVKSNVDIYISAIFFAITMMYVKIMILLGIFNPTMLGSYWYVFAIMIACSVSVAFFFYKKNGRQTSEKEELKEDEEDEKNPLEFKVAILFATLFVVFTLATQYAIAYFGNNGLNILSWIVGFTDINPFIINLFQLSDQIESLLLIQAAFQAIISNNVVKMFYGIFFSGKRITKPLIIGFSVICAVNAILLFTL